MPLQYIAASFPERIAFGARALPGWQTLLGRTIGGWENANEDWEDARHEYEVAHAIRTQSEYAAVRAHFHMARGRARKWRFPDPLDYHTNESGINGTGEDTRQPALATATANQYQAHKRYGTGVDAYDRKITRLRTGTIAVYRTRGATITNITGSTTIAVETGIFTVTGHVGGDTYQWTGEFDVPCRYDVDRLPAAIPNKQGGTNAPELFVEGGAIPIVEVRE